MTAIAAVLAGLLAVAPRPGATCVRADADGVTVVRGGDAVVAGPGLRRWLATMAVLQLVDHGIVDPRRPVRDEIPGFRDGPFGRPARVHHLLFHTAGLSASAATSGDVEADLDRHGPTRREPGRLVEPSPLGDELLEAIVERRTGRPFSAYVRENLLEPLGIATVAGATEGPGEIALRAKDVARLSAAVVARGTHGGVVLWDRRTGRLLLAAPGGLVAPTGARPGAPRTAPSGHRLVYRLGRGRGGARLVVDLASDVAWVTAGGRCR